jgi:PTS system cellobiose-specific IIC component
VNAPGATSSPLGGLRGRLQGIGDFFARQRHLTAVRDGVVGALPLVLTGSLFLLVAQPPSAALQAWMAPYTPLLLVPFRMLGGLIALYVTFCAAHSLAKSYSLDPQAAGLLAMAAYLVAAMPTPFVGTAPTPPVFVSGMESIHLAAPPGPPPSLPLHRLGAGGIFAGLLLAFFSVELTRFFVHRRLTIRLPSSAPEAVVRSFSALVPALATITLTFLVVHVAAVDLISVLEHLARPFVVAAGSLPAVLVVVGVDSLLWLLGVHASAAIATLRPLWETMLIQNMEAATQGLPLPHVAPQPFYWWFVWQGGSGATLALTLLLARARSAQLKGVGRLGLVPAFFNINEPVLFGAPVVMNPGLAVPFFLAPVVSATVAYAAFHFNLVTRMYLEMPWTLPAPIGAFLSSGGDYRAVLLQLFNLAISMLIYWPFIRRYDLRLLAQEQAKAAQAPAVSPAPQAG